MSHKLNLPFPIVASPSVPKDEFWMLSPVAAEATSRLDTGLMTKQFRDVILARELRARRSIAVKIKT